MRVLGKFAWVEIKLFLREPAAVFFTLAFPVMMLFIFGSVFGNNPSPLFGGFGVVDVAVPAYSALIIATSGMFSLPMDIALRREQGILRRLQATPLRPHTILTAHVIVLFLMTVLGMLLLVVTGTGVYGLRFDGNPLSVLAAFILSSMSIFAFGFLLASILPTARTAQSVVMVLFYPMIFLSGATVPREFLPETVQNFAQFLPLTHVVTLLRGMWVGEPWGAHWTEAGILAALFVACAAASARTFRWN